MKLQRHLFISLVALAGALTAAQASAGTSAGSDARHLVVRYSDLDLSQPQDAHRLYMRIERAAQLVCDTSAMGDLRLIAEYKSCMKRAVSEAVQMVRATQPPERLYAQFGK